MKAEVAKQLVEAAERVGFACEVYPDYSGRGMFGARTTGIVVPSMRAYAAACAEMGYRFAENGDTAGAMAAFRELKSVRSDNMGRDVIVY